MVAFLVSVLCVWFAVPAEAATGGISATVTSVGSEETAIDGCLQVYTLGRELVQQDCGTLTGETFVPDIAPGTYKVRYSDFTGLENVWHGGAAAFEEASVVTVAAGHTTELAVALHTAATIQGVFGESVTTLHEGPMYIYDLKGRLIDTTYPFDDSGVLRFHFEHVPAGTYKIRYVPNDVTSGVWYTEPGDIAAAPITVTAGQTTAPLTLEARVGGIVSFDGLLNTPVAWDAETVCAVAVNHSNVAVSADCGSRGGYFSVDAPSGAEYALAFVAGPVTTAQDYADVEVPVRYWPNSADFDDAQFWVLNTAGDTLTLPIWFFTDVYGDDWSSMWAIKWMGDAGISKGYADGTFRPKGRVQRSEAALFLYRQAGEPSVSPPTASPYRDVKASSAAYKAIYWLHQEGISTANPFEPSAEITRRQAVMFLYRAAGEPTVKLPKKSPFTDVRTTDVGYTAIVWAAQQNVAVGYFQGDFRPAQKVLRSQMAKFLYRFSAL